MRIVEKFTYPEGFDNRDYNNWNIRDAGLLITGIENISIMYQEVLGKQNVAIFQDTFVEGRIIFSANSSRRSLSDRSMTKKHKRKYIEYQGWSLWRWVQYMFLLELEICKIQKAWHNQYLDSCISWLYIPRRINGAAIHICFRSTTYITSEGKNLTLRVTIYGGASVSKADVILKIIIRKKYNLSNYVWAGRKINLPSLHKDIHFCLFVCFMLLAGFPR